jgi:hypothetical protein
MKMKKGKPEMFIKDIFSNPSFRSWSNGEIPNKFYGDGKNVGAVVAMRSRGVDFALNLDALDYVCKAEAEGRIKEGYVVLAVKENGGAPGYVAHARANEVAERLRNVTPRDGKWGKYYWLTSALQPEGVNNEPEF